MLSAASDELWCMRCDVVMKARFQLVVFVVEWYQILWPYVVRD